jgi:zinc transporter 1/2/3
MAVGLAVRNSFNGTDRTTFLMLGSLDAVSAGILVWVGVAEMWAGDWLYGEMANSGVVKTGVGMGSLVLGMGVMAGLGKWA